MPAVDRSSTGSLRKHAGEAPEVKMVSPTGQRTQAQLDAWANSLSKKKVNADVLKSGYTPAKRRFEIASITICSATWLFLCYLVSGDVATLIFPSASAFPLPGLAAYPLLATVVRALPAVVLMALSLFSGLLFADFVSGILHWSLDTWGSTTTPVFGNFIRSFREHHVSPRAMCDHDFVETNGDTFFILFPFLLSNLVFGTSPYFRTWLVAATSLIAITNQIHKWAHAFPADVPAVVRWFQANGIFIGRSHHNTHHVPPHMCSYCITNGWMNPFLDFINFWRGAEFVICRLTGAEPRADDFHWTCLDKGAFSGEATAESPAKARVE
eukprot:TRINITY_DN4099_c1_g1_i1.p1 TRINITY_DN4099_c1_g1~~TRINITY_DN4099_c1_g1_i1.p1  ORF type:complete len:326 (-),score=35.30 TRINITY_DN4099_c1_g1_i1:318-1295(-)